jgi:hypothetical protein
MKLSSEAELVVSIWDTVRDILPHNKRAEVAKDLLFAFADFGFESADLVSIADEDPDLSEAFDEVFPPPEFDEEEIDES